MSQEFRWRVDIEEVTKGFEVAPAQISPDLVQAMVQQESGGDPWAYRFEPDFYDRYIKNNEKVTAPAGVSLVTEQIGRATSFGLMQIMGQVARERGFQGRYLTALCEPTVGLLWGCRHLARFFERHKNLDDAIASYNAGSPRKSTDGTYSNQKYVDAVKIRMKAIRGEVLTDVERRLIV